MKGMQKLRPTTVRIEAVVSAIVVGAESVGYVDVKVFDYFDEDRIHSGAAIGVAQEKIIHATLNGTGEGFRATCAGKPFHFSFPTVAEGRRTDQERGKLKAVQI